MNEKSSTMGHIICLRVELFLVLRTLFEKLRNYAKYSNYNSRLS